MLSVQELRLLQAVISSENYVRTVFFAEIGEAAENLFVQEHINIPKVVCLNFENDWRF
jgi:hypothetical protein